MLVAFMPPSVESDRYASELQGLAVESYDGNARLVTQAATMYNGNITAIEMNDIMTASGQADDAFNDGTVGEVWMEDDVTDGFMWNADESQGGNEQPYYWETNPEEIGENLIYLAEFQYWDEQAQKTINYTWISNIDASSTGSPPSAYDQYVKYEPIPQPEVNLKATDPVGPTWINISIPHFKYTDFNATKIGTDRKGTFDCFQSYAVFIKGGTYNDWTHIGNSKHDPAWDQGAEPPLVAIDNTTNPGDINTGRDYFTAKNLDPETDYNFMVRVNFQSTDGDDMGPVWGYGGGLGDLPRETRSGSRASSGGSGTTFGSSGGGSVFPTEPDDQPPNVSITSPNQEDQIASNSVTIEWNGSDDNGIDHYEIKRDNGTWIDVGSSTSYDYTGLSEDNHTVYVTAYDTINQTATDNVTFFIAYSNNVSMTSTGDSDGWNFLSTKLIPLDTSLTAILDDPENGIQNNYSKVMYYDAGDGRWKTYVPSRASHYNDLSTWDRTMGLWIEMINDDTLSIRGTEPSTTDITLYPSWNMVGYPSTITGNNGLPVEVTKIGVFNASCEYNIEYNYTPSTYNFEPGKAYWIYNDDSSSVIWTVNY
ncbi:MAG: Ig-like domain-containing protein [Thermoplasmata archaeon]